MLQAADLDCERGGRRLFSGLSFGLNAGEILRVAGENGRGKTSLLRILCGLLAPSAGEVRWKGRPLSGLREEFSRQVLYLGHAPGVKDELTAVENLRIACELAGLRAGGSAMDEALGAFDVPRERPVGRLSQGQRRRAALARLAIGAPVPLWILDEPLAALDARAAHRVETLVNAHAARGGLIAFTTHQATDIAATRTLDLDALHA